MASENVTETGAQRNGGNLGESENGSAASVGDVAASSSMAGQPDSSAFGAAGHNASDGARDSGALQAGGEGAQAADATGESEMLDGRFYRQEAWRVDADRILGERGCL